MIFCFKEIACLTELYIFISPYNYFQQVVILEQTTMIVIFRLRYLDLELHFNRFCCNFHSILL